MRVPNRTDVLILGAGKIGAAIAELLIEGRYSVTVLDVQSAALSRLGFLNCNVCVADINNETILSAEISRHAAVISALPFGHNITVARLAASADVHYFDLTEDVAVAREVKRLAVGASSAFVPQCGLAPGLVCVIGNTIAQQFDDALSLQLRVGALPQYSTNSLGYGLTWSTEGLINEYCNSCEAIIDGVSTSVEPLNDVERIVVNGTEFEAFNTSGGLGSLCESWLGRLNELSYKTLRYPGHRDRIKFLLRDLQMSKDRPTLIAILEKAIPRITQDFVVLLVSGTGMRDDRLEESSYSMEVRSRERKGRIWTAIELTTALGVCAMVELLFTGALPRRGFVKQEDAKLEDLLGNRYGKILCEVAELSQHTIGVSRPLGTPSFAPESNVVSLI
ncbi:saccharopine dehydrogenase family protein [Bradyrhizobium prioriisuperbiae]|uniref:saccharopine dehydrogenase family protein n=1 Tax=Bradyrhizobium prioriisuperbiae TaxID=2854389 RepID=UPI0028E973EA|nr:saccharopine dehydrogenase C-terminal domain-containing protein [Bradyrhizobium prioritasuperba]